MAGSREQPGSDPAIRFHAEEEDILMKIKVWAVEGCASFVAYSKVKVTTLRLLQEKGHIFTTHAWVRLYYAVIAYHTTCARAHYVRH